MKKVLILLVCWLTLGLTGVAEPYSFTDFINSDRLIWEGNNYPYTHDLTQEIPAGDIVTSATITLGFAYDFYDGTYFQDWVTAIFDGQTWNLGDVDNGPYSNSILMTSLADRSLNVTIAVTNNNRGPGNVYLNYSQVSGIAYTPSPPPNGAPVPEPTTMLLLGSGLLGLGVLRRKLKK